MITKQYLINIIAFNNDKIFECEELLKAIKNRGIIFKGTHDELMILKNDAILMIKKLKVQNSQYTTLIEKEFN
jgi:hypothetical protein